MVPAVKARADENVAVVFSVPLIVTAPAALPRLASELTDRVVAAPLMFVPPV